MPINFYDDAVTKWNDADVFGSLNTSEIATLLDKKFSTLVGFSSKQRRGTWRLWSASLRDIIDIKLSRHEQRRKKDGDAFVFACARANGKDFEYPNSEMTLPLCGRARDDIEAVTFAGYDIDDGDDLNKTVTRLKQLGYFAILYTTHSHGKARDGLGEKTLDKYRILFPLAEPFELAPNNPLEHERRCREWRERLVGFADQRLELEIDESGCDVNRLFYTPRHKPGDRNWYSAIFAGRAVRMDEMPVSPKSTRKGQRRSSLTAENCLRSSTLERPILSDGFDLVDWRRDWGRFFKVREFFDFLQWDLGHDSEAKAEARILCPSDNRHSTPNDNLGCWIKDGNGCNPFAIHCHHNACQEMGALDQLIELESHVDLPVDYQTLSQLLCDSALYGNDGCGRRPDRLRYLRWDPQMRSSNATTSLEREEA